MDRTWPQGRSRYAVIEQGLARFLEAQGAVLAQVELELAAGAKRSHWMWFLFPQIAGTGKSPMNQRYAISGIEEARAYLAHPVLGARLRQHVRLVLSHTDRSAHAIFGSPDDRKFRSCLTLFREAALDPEDRVLFEHGLRQFYGGEADPRTLELLSGD